MSDDVARPARPTANAPDALAPAPIDEGQPLTTDEERAFGDERARPMRTRVLFLVAVSLLIWGQMYFLYESEVFASKLHSRVYRLTELVVSLALAAFAWKRRPLRQLEWATAGALSVLAFAHAGAILVVNADCVLPFTITNEYGVIVVALALSLSLRPTLVLLGLTWVLGTLVTAIRAKWDVDLSDHLVLLGIYGIIAAAIRSTDRLRRREFVARVRLDRANAELRKAEEIRGRLFVNLSHDFRTPLALIHAEADLLEKREGADERRRVLDRMRAQTMALADLTNQLLELARLEAGKTPIDARDFDVRAVATEIAAQFQGASGAAVVRVVDDASETTGVHADPGHVRRVLTNLVANAVRQLRDEGEARIVLAPARDGGVVIDVEDDGPGVEPSRRAAIFERFASFDATGSVASGIGLPVARELAELNGGSLELVDGAKATTFRLRLPAATGPLEEVSSRTVAVSLDRVATNDEAHDAAANDERPARSLLIVEDHPDMRRLLSELLAGGFSIRTAATCAEARAALDAAAPTAVLCDVLLPDGAGYDVLAHLRGQRRLDGVPLLFVSALGDPEQRTRGLAAGADDYVAKPFSAEELVARVESACERAEERRRALESQRLELVAELHDGVSASLSRASMLLAAAERSQASSEIVSRARREVKEALAEARALMSVMDGAAVRWDELVHELSTDVERDGEAFGIEVALDVRSDDSALLVSAVERHTLRRVAREAMTNALKHGGSRAVRCRIELARGGVTLSIESEQGNGSSEAGTGRGLAIAKRRVEQLGGSIAVARRAEGAMVLEASFPLELRAPARGEAGAA